MAWTRRSVVGGFAASVLPLSGSRRGLADAMSVQAATTAATSPTDGVVVLEAGPGMAQVMPRPAPKTAVWAYNGQVPGPLIRVTKGSEVKVRLVNKLSQPTTLSWHGVRNLNAMDGVGGLTQPPVMPGASFDYRFTPPDSGFYWYHPHVFPHSAEQIGRGLYGLLLVDEVMTPDVDRDVLVVLDDWSLDAEGQIKNDFAERVMAAGAGHMGALVTVDGRPIPRTFEVRPGSRARLRILNACAARIAILSCEGLGVSVMAIDGQPSEVFPPAGGTIPIGPGSRFEVFADMPRESGKTATVMLRGDGGPGQTLLAFTTKGRHVAERPAVRKLPPNPLLPERIPLEKALKRDLVIGGGVGAPPVPPAAGSAGARSPATPKNAGDWLWTLDGAGSDGLADKPLFRVKRGGAVSLAFVNKSAFVQQMHVHGHVFRVLHDLDDGWDPYWRESILVAPGRTKHVAFVADNPGKWAIESLILDRQVTGLAGWFQVG